MTDVFSREVTFIIEDRATGNRRIATREDLREVLTQIGLEIVPRGTVDWGPYPNQELMEKQIDLLTQKLADLARKPK